MALALPPRIYSCVANLYRVGNLHRISDSFDLMMAHILSISYDERLLLTRELMLEKQGYNVSSALGLGAAIKLCRVGDYDLVILGHSIPHDDKEQIVKTLRRACHAPVLALLRLGERHMRTAEYNHELQSPEQFLDVVGKTLAGRDEKKI
jgi:CheY-like chemotaxis protein